MMDRLEYKYLVPHDFLDTLRQEIRPYLVMDDHARCRPAKQYTVRSVYFDTFGLDCYHDKKEGLKVRAKYRLRGYDELQAGSVVFLEVKKKYINFIGKHRAPVLWRNIEALFSDFEVILSTVSAQLAEEVFCRQSGISGPSW